MFQGAISPDTCCRRSFEFVFSPFCLKHLPFSFTYYLQSCFVFLSCSFVCSIRAGYEVWMSVVYIFCRSVGSFCLCINRFLVTHGGGGGVGDNDGICLFVCFFSLLVLIYTFPSVSFLKTKTQEKRTPIYLLRAYLILMHHYTLL